MTNLEKIKKIYSVFRIIAMIAMIFSFIFAGTNLVGILVAATLKDFLLELLELGQSTRITDSLQLIANLITGVVTGVTNGLVATFSMNYFASAAIDGTPFTRKGASDLKSLGIKTIVMPLCAVIVNAIVLACFKAHALYEIGNGTSITTGIFMLIFSVVIAYGAELEEKAKGMSKANQD